MESAAGLCARTSYVQTAANWLCCWLPEAVDAVLQLAMLAKS
jgi:hypothetical protein